MHSEQGVIPYAVIFGEAQNRAANYLGPTIFGTIGLTSLIAAYIFIPIYIGVRTMMERISINAEKARVVYLALFLISMTYT